jgi:hypothetical protein
MGRFYHRGDREGPYPQMAQMAQIFTTGDTGNTEEGK